MLDLIPSAAVRLNRRQRWFGWFFRAESLLLVGLLLAVIGTVVGGTAGWVLLSSGGVAGIVALRAIRRQGGLQLLGPHFFYELVQLARRGRSNFLRVLYMMFVLVGLALAYQAHFHGRDLVSTLFATGQALPPNALARIAQSFVFAILTVQNAAVILLTPAYVAGAVAEEREGRTLEMLFTTHLRDREIILGKLCSRVAHLAVVLLAGLPILSLVQLWGGVDMGLLLAGFASTGLTLFSVASVSLLISVISRTVVGAMVGTYAVVLPFGFCFFFGSLGFGSTLALLFGVNPGGAGNPAQYLLHAMLALTAVHGTIIVFCLSTAIMGLRGLEQPTPPPPPRRVFDRRRPAPPPLVVGQTLPPPPPPVPLPPLPPVSERPLLWKEIYVGTQAIGIDQMALFFVVQVMVWTFLGAMGGSDSSALRLFCALLAGFTCVLVGFRAVGSVVRERQQKTLDNLLTIPVNRTDILAAKWLGSVLRLRRSGVFLGIYFLGLLFILHPLAVPLLLVALLVHVSFFASLGLWLSVTARTVLRAHFILALIILFVVLAPWLVDFYRASRHATWWSEFLGVGLNPLRTWWYLAFPVAEVSGDRDFTVRLVGMAAGLALYGALAYALWHMACKRFELERGLSRPSRN